MSGGDDNGETLRIMEALLTAEVVNSNPDLDPDDLTPLHRELFGVGTGSSEIKRPVNVSVGTIARVLHIDQAYEKLRKNPFVGYEEFGQRLRITAIDPAAKWLLAKNGEPLIQKNPALARFYENFDSVKVSYARVRDANPRHEDTRAFLDGRVAKAISEQESLRNALDLLILWAPDEIEVKFEDLVTNERQAAILTKVETALKNRALFQKHRIYETGKLLFVGPPGTGKTSFALAISHKLHMPVLEVRLSMVTSQYLGETSKNIDRVFEFAKKLAPCILFIDEFDYVAKSRVTDDHGAMKRAVNMLLKNIDRISLIRDGVLLIGATNHPQLLDEAAWRRFDEVVEFVLPDLRMRRAILQSVLQTFTLDTDLDKIAEETEGFSGSDIRILVKEALISALVQNRDNITACDIDAGIDLVLQRNSLKSSRWV